MKENNFLNLFAALLTSTASPTTAPQDAIGYSENITLVLAENVRRQLMKDNYDYLIDQTTATTLLTNPYHTEDNPEEKKRAEEVEIASSAEKVRKKSHSHNRRSKYINKSNKTTETTDGVEELPQNEEVPISGAMRRSASSPGKVKYSLLKVKGPLRRSAAQPRLLKEEKENEVSIVNLGEGPVPQFRLPQSHRQYRAEDSDSDRSSSSDIANVSDSAVDLDR